ncbi:MAG: hypothetical protein ACP5RD_05600 [bacterium]
MKTNLKNNLLKYIFIVLLFFFYVNLTNFNLLNFVGILSVKVLANSLGQIRGTVMLDYSISPGIGSGTTPGLGVSVYLEPIPPTPGLPQQTLTNSSASFEFINLAPGKYKLTISKPQFKTQIIEIEINPGDIKIVNIVLNPEKRKDLDSTTVGLNYDPNSDKVYIAIPSDYDTPGGIPPSAGPEDMQDLAAIQYGANPLEYADRKYFTMYGQDGIFMGNAINGLAIMSTQTDGKIKANVNIGSRVHLLAFNKNYSKLYGLDFKANFYVISPTNNNKVINKFSLSTEHIPSDIVVGNNFVYVSLMGPEPKITIIDANRDFPVNAIILTKNPKLSKIAFSSTGILQVQGLALSYDQSKLFATFGDSNVGYLLTLNARTLEVENYIKVGAMPIGVATPDGRRIYVANYNDNTVSLIDAKNNIEVGRFKTGYKPSKIVVHPSLKYVYVSNEGSNYISVIDVLASKILFNIQVKDGPSYMGISPYGDKLYVSCKGSKTVCVVDLVKNSMIAESVPALYATPCGIAVKQ